MSVELMIHKFSWPGKTNTSEQDALDLISTYTDSVLEAIASIKDKDGWSLLHHACYRGWFDVAKVLVDKYKTDPHQKNNYHSTPLHWAAFGGHSMLVRYLVSELNCNPNSENKRGNTPLQIACWRGNLEVVKFLVLDCKCNPLKPNNNRVMPLYEAFVCSHVHIVSFLLSTGVVDAIIPQFKLPELLSDWYTKLFRNILDFRKTNPLKPTLKVFVLGDTGVGKTTLVNALRRKLCGSKMSTFGGKYRKVSSVTPHTVGVNPIHLDSSENGPMTLFDFAGHQEFYSSHAALLENFESSKGAVLLILLDLTKTESELKSSLGAWMSFLDSIYSNNRPPSVFIGSHSDILKRRGEKPDVKLHSVCDSANLLMWDANCKLLAMNCTKVSSNELNAVTDELHEHFSKYQGTFNIDAQTHVINAVIKEHFKHSSACQVSDVIELLEHQSQGLFEHNLLPSPSDFKSLSELISQLSDLGEFVYLKDDNFRDGWIVFNKHLLFTEVSGTVFAPENFRSQYGILNSTGVVPKEKLMEAFKNHNVEMICKFLAYFNYCCKIHENNCPDSKELYFFPQLVNESKPTDLSYFKGCSYTCVWQLKCKKNYQCFVSRFTQSIIVQLATSFGLTPAGIDESCFCPVIVTECNVWNLGIHWKNMDGVEVVVEFDQSYKIMLLKLGCQHDAELYLVKLRSKIIKMIQQIQGHCLKDIETLESFIYPPNLNFQSQYISYEYTKDRLSLAVTDGKKFVTSKQGSNIEQIRLSDLLFMEPFSLIPNRIITVLFSVANADTVVDSNLLEELKIISRNDKSNFLASGLKPNMKCAHLREYINSYSIFSDQEV